MAENDNVVLKMWEKRECLRKLYEAIHEQGV
jgi:hypothetical protein